VFTGIVQELGRVVSFDGARLIVKAPETAAAAAGIGDSVAVAGCCLTIVGIDDGRLSFDVVPESVRRTTFAGATAGVELNLERALQAGQPLAGHFLQGHVDGVGRVRSVEPEGDGRRLWVEAPEDILRLCVEKGSIAVDGVSLTVAQLDSDGFAVALIPHTLAATTLGALRLGDGVNLEADILAKHVERLLATR